MKSVTIKNTYYKDPISQQWSDNGFTISFDDGDEATFFELSSDFSSKLIPKKGFVELWNKLIDVNFQKVLLENETYQGYNGDNSIVEISEDYKWQSQ